MKINKLEYKQYRQKEKEAFSKFSWEVLLIYINGAFSLAFNFCYLLLAFLVTQPTSLYLDAGITESDVMHIRIICIVFSMLYLFIGQVFENHRDYLYYNKIKSIDKDIVDN